MGFQLLGLKTTDTGRFLKYGPPFLGAGLQQPIYFTLFDQAIGVGSDTRAAKKILEGAGYKLAVSNIGFHEVGYPYEDWYYHPDVVDIPEKMIAKKDTNFIWDYMMEPIA